MTQTSVSAEPTASDHIAPREAKSTKNRTKARWILVLQVVLTLGAFSYLLMRSDLPALARAFKEAPLWCIPAATATLLVVMFAGTVRWHLLMSAYGARSIPKLGYLFRLQVIGLFYNMMPGAVGGDVLRGVVSRHAFGPQGMSAGLTVVLVERVFGLIGLMLLVVSVLSFHPINGLQLSPWMFVAGLVGSVVALMGIALGRRVAPYLPRVLAARAATLPALSNTGAFIAAMVVSVVNQALVGLMGHMVIAPLAAQVGVLDSLVLSPLAFAAIFFPLTVAGAGTRDAAMVAFYGLLGVNKEAVLSASFEILLAYALVAALGGALSLVTPLRDQPADGNVDAKA